MSEDKMEGSDEVGIYLDHGTEMYILARNLHMYPTRAKENEYLNHFLFAMKGTFTRDCSIFGSSKWGSSGREGRGGRIPALVVIVNRNGSCMYKGSRSEY